MFCSESVSGAFPDLFRVLLRKCSAVLGAHPNLKSHDDFDVKSSGLAIPSTSHRGARMGSALGSAPGNRGAPGGCSRECSGKLGVLQGVLPRVLFLLTLRIEHSREHSLDPPPGLEHPQFP